VSWNGNAKSREENDSVFMTKVLALLRDLARESGWSIIVLHHNSRSRNEYAGNAAVAANMDIKPRPRRNSISRPVTARSRRSLLLKTRPDWPR
jgi:hypothetical protein